MAKKAKGASAPTEPADPADPNVQPTDPTETHTGGDAVPENQTMNLTLPDDFSADYNGFALDPAKLGNPSVLAYLVGNGWNKSIMEAISGVKTTMLKVRKALENGTAGELGENVVKAIGNLPKAADTPAKVAEAVEGFHVAALREIGALGEADTDWTQTDGEAAAEALVTHYGANRVTAIYEGRVRLRGATSGAEVADTLEKMVRTVAVETIRALAKKLGKALPKNVAATADKPADPAWDNFVDAYIAKHGEALTTEAQERLNRLSSIAAEETAPAGADLASILLG